MQICPNNEPPSPSSGSSAATRRLKAWCEHFRPQKEKTQGDRNFRAGMYLMQVRFRLQVAALSACMDALADPVRAFVAWRLERNFQVSNICRIPHHSGQDNVSSCSIAESHNPRPCRRLLNQRLEEFSVAKSVMTVLGLMESNPVTSPSRTT